MAIKIDFMSDVSQVVRGVDSIGDRLDAATDDLADLGQAGERAADGLAEVGDAGRDLDRIGDGTADAARDLEDLGRAGEDAADSLGDTERALKDLGDSGTDAGRGVRDIGDDFDRTAEDVEQSAKTMDDKVEKAFRNMADHARTNTGRMSKSTKADMDTASRSTETFKNEAKQNFSETFSSFDGSVESLVDGIQGTFGGVAADLGPKGAIGAGVVAAAIGLGYAMMQKMTDAANEKGELAGALAEQIRDAGGAFDESDLVDRMEEWGYAIQDNAEWWEVWKSHAETGLEDVKNASEATGLSFSDMFKGAAGSAEDAEAALEIVNAKLEENRGNWKAWAENPIDMNKQGHELQELKEHLEDNIETQEVAKEVEEARAEAIGETTEGIADQIEAQEELTGVLGDSVESELNYLDALDKAKETIKENGATLDKHSEKGRENMRALLSLRDAAYDMAEAQVEAGESTAVVSGQLQNQREDFIATAEAAGYTRDQAERLADAYGLVPEDIITNVEAKGTDEAKRKLNDVANGKYDATVNTDVSGADSASRRLDRAARNRTSTIRVRTVGTVSTISNGRTMGRSAW